MLANVLAMHSAAVNLNRITEGNNFNVLTQTTKTMKAKEFMEDQYGIILTDEKAIIHPAMLEKAMNEFAVHQCQGLLEIQKPKDESQEVIKVVSKEVKLSSLNLCTTYKCKENDALIRVYTVDNKIDELHFKTEGDKGWVVIGYKDLQAAINKALTNFL